MKKIIYGLGAIAATVTPVVAVISCGKENSEAKQDLGKALADKGFTVSPSKLAELTKFIGDYSELVFKPGKLSDEGHKATDFAILVKGTPEKIAQTAAAITPSDPNDALYSPWNVASINGGDTNSLVQRWGFTDKDLVNTKAIIYLQNRISGATCETVKVVETTDKQYFTADAVAGKYLNITSADVKYKAVVAK